MTRGKATEGIPGDITVVTLSIVPPLVVVESYLHRKRTESNPIRMDVR